MTIDPRTLDPKNLDMLQARLSAREQITGPRVGDWIVRLDGKESRATYVWDDEDGPWIQDGGGSMGSFYLMRHGYEDYSGGLDPGIKASCLELTGETKEGFVWIWDRDSPGQNRGVSFPIQERVWKQVV